MRKVTLGAALAAAMRIVPRYRGSAADRAVVARRNTPKPARTWPSRTVRNATITDFMPDYEGSRLGDGPRNANTYRFIRREKAKEAYRRSGR